jgi:hypothetical protein
VLDTVWQLNDNFVVLGIEGIFEYAERRRMSRVGSAS